MSEERFKLSSETVLQYQIMDNDTDLNENEVVDLLNEQKATITKLKELNGDKGKRIISLIRTNKTLKEENEQLRLELETHKHPLWSTREAEKKVNKLSDSLADEVKKNGLLNEEINQLRIENMRLKKKCGDEMSEKNCGHCKHFQLDGMFGLWCEKDHDWTLVNGNCSDFER